MTNKPTDLSPETIQRPSLALKGIDHIERSDRLALRVLGVGDCVADDGFEEGFEDAAGFFVDHCRALSAMFCFGEGGRRVEGGLLAEIRFTPPRRARRRMAGLVMPWMLSRRILR